MVDRERAEGILKNAYAMAEKCRKDKMLRKMYGSYFEQLIGRYEVYLKEIDRAEQLFDDKSGGLFNDEYVYNIYRNCKNHMKNTREDWQKTADFFIEKSIKYPEKTDELLKCYNLLEEELNCR